MYATLCVAFSLAAWFALAVIPGRHNDAGASGGPFFLAVGAAAFVLGALAPYGPWRTGLLLALPALAIAWWTAPRGDNDGLWLLWFPILLALVPFAAACHWAGAALRHRRTAPPAR